MAKDYSLTGETGRAAVEQGLANPAWYRPKVDPAAIRALMAKSDAIALRDTGIWIGAMILSAGLAIALWPSWWSVPFWAVYGVLYFILHDLYTHRRFLPFKTNSRLAQTIRRAHQRHHQSAARDVAGGADQ